MINQMSRAEIEEKIKKLESREWNIEMKDHWSQADYAEIDNVRAEIRELNRKLEEVSE